MLVEAAAAASARRRSRAPLVAGAARGLKALNTRAEVVRSMRVFGDQTAAARRVGDLSSALRLSSSQLEASVLTPSLYNPPPLTRATPRASPRTHAVGRVEHEAWTSRGQGTVRGEEDDNNAACLACRSTSARCIVTSRYRR